MLNSNSENCLEKTVDSRTAADAESMAVKQTGPSGDTAASLAPVEIPQV